MPASIAVTSIFVVAPDAAAAAAALSLPLSLLSPLLSLLPLSLLPSLLPLPAPPPPTFADPVPGWLLHCTQRIDMCRHCCIVVATARIVLFLLLLIIAIFTAPGIVACPLPPSSCHVVGIALHHLPHVVCHPLISHCPPPPPLAVLSVPLLASCCLSFPLLLLSNTRLPPKLYISI